MSVRNSRVHMTANTSYLYSIVNISEYYQVTLVCMFDQCYYKLLYLYKLLVSRLCVKPTFSHHTQSTLNSLMYARSCAEILDFTWVWWLSHSPSLDPVSITSMPTRRHALTLRSLFPLSTCTGGGWKGQGSDQEEISLVINPWEDTQVQRWGGVEEWRRNTSTISSRICDEPPRNLRLDINWQWWWVVVHSHA